MVQGQIIQHLDKVCFAIQLFYFLFFFHFFSFSFFPYVCCITLFSFCFFVFMVFGAGVVILFNDIFKGGGVGLF